MKRLDYYEVDTVIREFTDTTKEYFGNHAYSAGFLGSMLNQLMTEVPVNRQQELLEYLKTFTLKYSEA